MKKLKVLLLGQPNVGKSSLLDSVAGSKAVVSNYPGTTVELTEAKKKIGNKEITFVDTPGIYSISDRSEEEKITEETLLDEDTDGAIIIADATSLERSLYMVLQVIEAGVPTVIALNFVEEANDKGIRIDSEKLENILNVPVIEINPITKAGTEDFLDYASNIDQYTGPSFEVEYDDHIEESITEVSTHVKSDLSERFVALRSLEGDEDFYRYLGNKGILDEIRQNLEEHPEIAKDISVTRYGTASFLAEQVTELIDVEERRDFKDLMDDLLLGRLTGPLITGISLLLIFGLLLFLGRWAQDFLMGWAERATSTLGTGNTYFSMILNQGLIGLTAGISIALPYVFLFYLLLGVLEDVGVLPRFIVNAERFLKKLNLPAKSFIPLALGLGCTAPATRATRVLSDRSEQFQASSFFPFVPCSSRIAIIMGVVGYYGGMWLAISVFLTTLLAGIVWGLGVNAAGETEPEPLILELPPYRKPLLSNVIAKSWIRMKDFVYIVIPLLAVGGMVYGVFEKTGLTQAIIGPLAPITRWLGLPTAVIVPLIFGFLQKDLTGAMLVSVLGVGVASVLTGAQLYTFGVASVIGIPCIIASGMLWREFGFTRSLLLTFGSIIYGYLVAGIIGNLVYLVT